MITFVHTPKPSSLAHSLQIHCTGLTDLRSHTSWVGPEKLDPTYIFMDKNKLSIKTLQGQIWTIFTLYRIIDRKITNPLKLQNLKTQIQTIPDLLVLLFVLKLGLLQMVLLHLQTHKRKENENVNQIIYGDRTAKLRI